MDHEFRARNAPSSWFDRFARNIPIWGQFIQLREWEAYSKGKNMQIPSREEFSRIWRDASQCSEFIRGWSWEADMRISMRMCQEGPFRLEGPSLVFDAHGAAEKVLSDIQTRHDQELLHALEMCSVWAACRDPLRYGNMHMQLSEMRAGHNRVEAAMGVVLSIELGLVNWREHKALLDGVDHETVQNCVELRCEQLSSALDVALEDAQNSSPERLAAEPHLQIRDRLDRLSGEFQLSDASWIDRVEILDWLHDSARRGIEGIRASERRLEMLNHSGRYFDLGQKEALPDLERLEAFWNRDLHRDQFLAGRLETIRDWEFREPDTTEEEDRYADYVVDHKRALFERLNPPDRDYCLPATELKGIYPELRRMEARHAVEEFVLQVELFERRERDGRPREIPDRIDRNELKSVVVSHITELSERAREDRSRTTGAELRNHVQTLARYFGKHFPGLADTTPTLPPLEPLRHERSRQVREFQSLDDALETLSVELDDDARGERFEIERDLRPDELEHELY
jgi:hypothetical protein